MEIVILGCLIFIVAGLSCLEFVRLNNRCKDLEDKIKELNSLIDNAYLSIGETNDNVNKINSDIKQFKSYKTLSTSEINSIKNTIKTLNNGFAIPSMKNTYTD